MLTKEPQQHPPLRLGESCQMHSKEKGSVTVDSMCVALFWVAGKTHAVKKMKWDFIFCKETEVLSWRGTSGLEPMIWVLLAYTKSILGQRLSNSIFALCSAHWGAYLFWGRPSTTIIQIRRRIFCHSNASFCSVLTQTEHDSPGSL